MNILPILSAWLWLSCSEKDNPPPFQPPVSTDTVVKQYGTPFANVTDRRDAVIYQVNTRVFSQQGNFAGVTARLDSIKALGVNVIYLMPVFPVGVKNAINSPYCIRDYTSVNSEFGTLDDLRTLVDGAHGRNMSVILDWVGNHTSWDNAWITEHKDWYLQDAAGNVISPPNTGWNDVAQLNYNKPALRQAMIKAMKYWVLAANVDGFRCDYADGVPVDFWKQAIDSLKSMNTHKLLFLAEGSRSANYTVGFDFNFGFSFFNNLKTVYESNGAATSIDNLNNSEYTSASNGQQMVRYTTNHDVNSSDGTPLELFGGKSGSMGAFVVVSYMKSVPMIYNGQEVATPVRMIFPFTSNKIDWEINPDVKAEYKKVIAFRNSSAAIRRGVLNSYSNADVCAFVKESGSEKVVVLVNMRNATVNYTVPAALVNTNWTNAINTGTVSLGSTVSLAPYSYWVLKN